jgi:hypothetical protein
VIVLVLCRQHYLVVPNIINHNKRMETVGYLFLFFFFSLKNWARMHGCVGTCPCDAMEHKLRPSKALATGGVSTIVTAKSMIKHHLFCEYKCKLSLFTYRNNAMSVHTKTRRNRMKEFIQHKFARYQNIFSYD